MNPCPECEKDGSYTCITIRGTRVATMRLTSGGPQVTVLTNDPALLVEANQQLENAIERLGIALQDGVNRVNVYLAFRDTLKLARKPGASA